MPNHDSGIVKLYKMIFKTLQNTSIEDLTSAFNESFQNYFVPIHFTPEQLLRKFKAEGVKLNLSVGAFEAHKLVGFILHATNEETGNAIAYNSGTGVIPEYRGQTLTTKMYGFIFPVLKSAGARKVILEAITANEKAIRIYKKLNFEIIRKVNCYKGTLTFPPNLAQDNISDQKKRDASELKELWDFEPTWQNSFYVVERQPELITNLFVEKENKIVGYLLLNNNNVMQFAVHKDFRKQGIGTALFRKAAELKNELRLINVDSGHEPTSLFLEYIGLPYTLSQYEMELLL